MSGKQTAAHPAVGAKAPGRSGGRRVNRRAEIGRLGEDLAARELESQGMEILDRNWSCRWGELDLIALETVAGQRTVVFCEVKCRTGPNFGDPLEAITQVKVRRLRRLAAEWLSGHPGVRADALRIDAIGVFLQSNAQPVLLHVTGIGD